MPQFKVRSGNFAASYTSADQYVTIYDHFEEPCGSLQRRRVLAHTEPNWRVFACNGKEIGSGYVSASQAIRAFAIWYAMPASAA
jgi:hypothetical protein